QLRLQDMRTLMAEGKTGLSTIGYLRLFHEVLGFPHPYLQLLTLDTGTAPFSCSFDSLSALAAGLTAAHTNWLEAHHQQERLLRTYVKLPDCHVFYDDRYCAPAQLHGEEGPAAHPHVDEFGAHFAHAWSPGREPLSLDQTGTWRGLLASGVTG